jgi:hypothetical protein
MKILQLLCLRRYCPANNPQLNSLSQSVSYFTDDWRFTANQFVLTVLTSPLRLTTSIYFVQLNTCRYSPHVTSCLTSGWVCRLQILLTLASLVILGSESHGTHDHIYWLRLETPPTWRARCPYLCPTQNRVAQLYPQALGSLFVVSYDSHGYGGGIPTRLHTGLNPHSTGMWSSLCSIQVDPIANTATNSFSIVMNGCLAIAKIWLTCLVAVAKQLMLRSLHRKRLYAGCP